MKKAIMILLGACVYGSVFSAAQESQEMKVINILTITDQDFHEFTQGNSPDLVLEIPAQTIFPVNFFLKGDLLNLSENESNSRQIEVKKNYTSAL